MYNMCNKIPFSGKLQTEPNLIHTEYNILCRRA